MQINTRIQGEITVADVSGNMDSLTSGQAAEELGRLAQGTSKLLLNLSGLQFLGSAGLLTLLRTAKQLHGGGGTLRICSTSNAINDVMTVSGFDKLLNLHATESEALDMFGG
ncbi:MAG: STAS domain-containing protein [Gammaproteobacteria bacterium]|nr:STAS domain-containing protein [Gammaproteobacteria bacterium]